MAKYDEKSFETEIKDHLVKQGGYVEASPKDFDRENALHTSTLIQFLKDTQPDSWKKLEKIHVEKIETKFLQRLSKELDQRGMLDVIRNGITDYGVKFNLAFFKPASGLNPDTLKQYNQNVLTVTRQVHYSTKNDNSVDLILSINGLPIATVELKNQFTGQDVKDSNKQYIQDRDPDELLFRFKKRALVHFSVDTDNVFMTTKLDGKKTRFLPFNKGLNDGAGNPLNKKGHRTSYLWEEVWVKDSWMDIVQSFLNIQAEEYKLDGETRKKETIIFPRYHQLDAVRKIIGDVKQRGVGLNYLVQHSAGSGKSNSIAWLAYRLQSLHDKADNSIFDSVIVITDRLVLDKQLQDTIYQFDHKHGVVQRIDENSTQLANHLKAGTNIIITTIQKFPFVLEKIGDLPKRHYAIIVDEAHSSQSGESSKKLKEVLREKELEHAAEEEEELPDTEDEVLDSMLSRGKQKNLSFFAFTATPKSKTLEVFGVKDEHGKPRAFHLYSMRQAIEEGFILDVLQNYTTYKTFYKLSKSIEDDPEVNKKRAKTAIARFLSLHPHNLAQKIEVIVEHFRQVTMKKIGGKAKAMVVTSSRLHVVRYKKEFDRYIKEKGYTDIKALVAFSGIVPDNGETYTEVEMNGIKEKELPNKFNTGEYQLLIVANKYQTGFDQPLLHTMYVDKKIYGVKAVQTLSRLNRTCPGKEDTFILDFVNKEEDILASFQPYYESTTLSEITDPNQLYDLKNKLEEVGVIEQDEIDRFALAFFMSTNATRTHAKLNAIIDPAVERFKSLKKKEVQEEFKHHLLSFLRLYSFLSQIMPFNDAGLEKFFAYGKFLYTKLPKRDAADVFRLNDEVALEYYRLQKINEGSILLQKGKEGALDPASELGTKKDKEEKEHLSKIIKIINDKFNTDWTEADKLFIDQIEEDSIANAKLVLQAKNNTIENFKHGYDDLFVNLLFARMDQNEDIFKKIMDNKSLRKEVQDYLMRKVYNRINEKKEQTNSYAIENSPILAVAEKKKNYGSRKVK